MQFLLNEDSKEIIRNILRSPKFQALKNKIEKYFNLKLYLINAMVSRNLPLIKKLNITPMFIVIIITLIII